MYKADGCAEQRDVNDKMPERSPSLCNGLPGKPGCRAANSAERDLAIDHDISAMRELERMECILLDQEYGQVVAPVQFPNGRENLVNQEGCEPERRLVEK